MDAPTLHVLLDENGIPRTINGRVKVMMIALKYRYGEPIEAIAEHYDITLADVHAALAYYHDNKEAMDAETARKEALAREIGVSGEEFRAKIEQRMKDLRDD